MKSPTPEESGAISTIDVSGIMNQGEFTWGIVSATGIALKDETPETEWHRITEEVCRIFEATGKKHAQAAMMLGDLLRFGDEKYHETYSNVIDATRDYMRVQIKTLTNWQWIAGKIAPSRRRENLSLGHHEAVARLAVEDQEKFLQLADDEGFNVKELRGAIREARPSKRKTKEKKTVTTTDNAQSVTQKLIECSNYLSDPDLVTKEMKGPLEKLHKLFRRKWQNGRARK